MDCIGAREQFARFQSGFRATACLMLTTCSGLVGRFEFPVRTVDPTPQFLERPASVMFFTHCSPMGREFASGTGRGQKIPYALSSASSDRSPASPLRINANPVQIFTGLQFIP